MRERDWSGLLPPFFGFCVLLFLLPPSVDPLTEKMLFPLSLSLSPPTPPLFLQKNSRRRRRRGRAGRLRRVPDGRGRGEGHGPVSVGDGAAAERRRRRRRRGGGRRARRDLSGLLGRKGSSPPPLAFFSRPFPLSFLGGLGGLLCNAMKGRRGEAPFSQLWRERAQRGRERRRGTLCSLCCPRHSNRHRKTTF